MSNNNIRILSEPISYQQLLSIKGLRVSGIYKIENLINHKVYIGQSKDVIKRLKEHTRKEDNKHLKNAFDKYGLDKFSFEVIKQTYDLDYWEMYLINIYHSQDSQYGYNILPGGEGGDSEVTKQQWKNPEIRRKRIESHKGKIVSLETREKLRQANLGKVVSEETKQKIREKRKLQAPLTKEQQERRLQHVIDYWNSSEGQKQKQINSERHKGSHTTKGKHWYNNGTKNVQTFECPEGYVPGRLGDFTCSEEAKRKKSEWYKNLTEEQRNTHNRKATEARKGKPKSDTCKANISKANKGRRYYNNGIIEVMQFEQPEGFVPGRLPSIKEKISKGSKKAKNK